MSEKREAEECHSEEGSSLTESFDANKSGTSETYDMKDFCPGIRIEAKDFDGKWYPAKVSDVDWTENEILVHFENWNTKFDEWIPMDSSRLRPIQKPVSQQKDVLKFSKGEEVMAVWSANQKYPGVIQAVLANDRYDVLFSDGFLKRLKAHKISKLQGGSIKPEVKTFSDIGTKEERRERKRKINVAELFHINKRSKKKGLANSKSREIKTYPVSKSRTKSSFLKKPESSEENEEGSSSSAAKEVKQSNDKLLALSGSSSNKALVENIPTAFEVKYLNGQTETWSKQLYQRSEGRTAGKLDIVILNPQGRKFRSRNEIMKYCEENGIVYTHEAFDFSAKGRPKSKPVLQTQSAKPDLNAEEKDKSLKRGGRKSQSDVLGNSQIPGAVLPQNEVLVPDGSTPKKVFIGDYEVVIENGKFICPVKICGKHFRRENLLHMHMKHYHPEFSKYLDYTPSVTDLAYARTVGNLDAVEIPLPTPRKLSGSEKSEKSAVKVENFRRTSEVSADSAKEAKKLKLSDNRVEGKTHPLKASSDISSVSVPSGEELSEESQKTKISSGGSQQGKSSSHTNETEAVFQETSGNMLDGSSSEQPPRESEASSSSAVKPTRHSRLHSRKKSSRFQGSFSEHIRKRRFISQDRSKHHSRMIGHQQQSQQPGQQFPPTQPLQTISPQPCLEETNSSSLSQGPTMTRYLKPHLNISNEMSGKSTLLTNYKILSPGSEGIQESGETNTSDNSGKMRKKNRGVSDRRTYLAGLLNARKRKRKAMRKHWRKRKRELLRCSVQSPDFSHEMINNESGLNEEVKKPDDVNDSHNNSTIDSLKTYRNSPDSFTPRRLSMDGFEPDDENSKSDFEEEFRSEHFDSLKTILGTDNYPLTSAKKNDEKTDVSGAARNEVALPPPECKTKAELDAKAMPRAYVLLENIYRKGNAIKNSSNTLRGNENMRSGPDGRMSPRKTGKRKRKKLTGRGRLPAKKVRFESSAVEKGIDVGEGFDCGKQNSISGVGIRNEEPKRRQRKFPLNEGSNEFEVSQQKLLDDSSRAESCFPNKKTRGLDQAEVTEDSKSPLAVESDKVEKLRRNEIINCLCGITEEDGLMIQCDICLCWQHGHCAGILRELDVPDKYTCAICKNPFRGRSSMKHLNDQEWLKEGTLPSLTFRSKRNDIIDQRKTILKRSHDLSGSITLLAQVIHSLRIKVNIAEKKDHPKLWLWAKKWTEKKPNRLKEETEVKEERTEEPNLDLGGEAKKEQGAQDEQYLPKAPEPEAPIDSAECRLNLLDHLIHYQSLVDDRLSCIESLVAELESMQDDAVNDETPDRYPRTKATVQMILRDLNTMKKIATI